MDASAAAKQRQWWISINKRIHMLGDYLYQEAVKEPVYRVLVLHPQTGAVTADWSGAPPLPSGAAAETGAETPLPGMTGLTSWSSRIRHTALENTPIVGLDVMQNLSGAESILEMALDNEYDTNSARVATGDFIWAWLGYQDELNYLREAHDQTVPPFNTVKGMPAFNHAVFGGRVVETGRQITTAGDRLHVIGIGWGALAQRTELNVEQFASQPWSDVIEQINTAFANEHKLHGKPVIRKGAIHIDEATLSLLPENTPENWTGRVSVYKILVDNVLNELKVPEYLFWWTPAGRFYFDTRDSISEISRNPGSGHYDVKIGQNTINAWFRDTMDAVPTVLQVYESSVEASDLEHATHAEVVDVVTYAQHGGHMTAYNPTVINWATINPAVTDRKIRAALEQLKDASDKVALDGADDPSQSRNAKILSAGDLVQVHIKGLPKDSRSPQMDERKFKYLRQLGMLAMANMLVNRMTGYFYIVGAPMVHAFGDGFVPTIHVQDTRLENVESFVSDTIQARRIANALIGKVYPRRIVYNISGLYFATSVRHWLGADGFRTGVGFARSLSKIEREDPYAGLYRQVAKVADIMGIRQRGDARGAIRREAT